jgi:hypothetical protein
MTSPIVMGQMPPISKPSNHDATNKYRLGNMTMNNMSTYFKKEIKIIHKILSNETIS